MRCTNRPKIFAAIGLILVSTAISGCQNKNYTFAYTPDTSVTAFRLTENADAEAAVAFAGDLCVTAQDVTEAVQLIWTMPVLRDCLT